MKYVMLLSMILMNLAHADSPSSSFMSLEACVPVLRMTVGQVPDSALIKVRSCTLDALVKAQKGDIKWQKIDDDAWVLTHQNPEGLAQVIQFRRDGKFARAAKVAVIERSMVNGAPEVRQVMGTPYNAAPIIDVYVYEYLKAQGLHSAPVAWNIWD